jgi:hypothetical protein
MPFSAQSLYVGQIYSGPIALNSSRLLAPFGSIYKKEDIAVAQQNHFDNSGRWITRGAIAVLFSAAAALLSACGGGGAASPDGGVQPNAPPALTVALTDPTTNAAVTSVTPEWAHLSQPLQRVLRMQTG